MSQKNAPEDEQSGSDGKIIKSGVRADILTIRRTGPIVYITAEHDVTGSAMLDAVTRAIEADVIGGHRGVLVDLRKFSGTVDWDAMHRLRGLAAWSQPGRDGAPTAYLVRGGAFESLIRLLGALFPNARHRSFQDRRAALAWLNTPPAAP